MKKTISLAFAGLFICSGAFGSGDLFGAGASSCAQYLSYKDDPVLKSAFTHWSNGFISGLNAFRCLADTCLELDSEALKFIAEQYCNENPLDLYMDAMVHYVALVDEKKAK